MGTSSYQKKTQTDKNGNVNLVETTRFLLQPRLQFFLNETRGNCFPKVRGKIGKIGNITYSNSHHMAI